ncbi:MAG: hypothetical protein CJBNEKGG_02651 [Prosthecobacter sp.]|nr:hypothetical protein [Prosthecobacter sp.]
MNPLCSRVEDQSEDDVGFEQFFWPFLDMGTEGQITMRPQSCVVLAEHAIQQLQKHGNMKFTINEVSLRTLCAYPFSRTGSNPQGDLLHDGYTRTFTWSGRSEILSVTTQVAVGTTVKESFTYDGLQRRISRTDASGTTFFIHDGWNVIAEYRRVGTANVLQRRYLWGEDLSGSLQGAGGVGGLVQAVDYTPGNAGSYHYHYDGNGNIVEITNVSAAVVASYRYDAFGRTLAKSGIYADANRYRFSTKSVEHTSALYYYGYRFYDPTHGRWTTRDPIAERGGINHFAMLANDVVNQSDYLGLDINDLISDYLEANGIGFNDNQAPGEECGKMSGFYRHCMSNCMARKKIGIVPNNIAMPLVYGLALLAGGDDGSNDAIDSDSDRDGNRAGLAAGSVGADFSSVCLSAWQAKRISTCCLSNFDINNDDPRCCKDKH